MMLTPLPVSRVAHEWERIAAALKPAVKRDPKHNMADLFHDALTGNVQLWRPTAPADGYFVTQASKGKVGTRRTFWVIYTGGTSGGASERRMLLADLEDVARLSGCNEIKFEGRAGWRRVCPDYKAIRDNDRRWHYRKALT